MLLEAFRGNFSNINKYVSRSFLEVCEGMVRSSSCNTSEVAKKMCTFTRLDFHASDARIYRLLSSPWFKVDDKFWRSYIKSIFDVLEEHGNISYDSKIVVAIDFTSDRDDFLILCASIVIAGASIPIYFSMRNYPKRKDRMDQKKMELAFIKALRHILTDKYKYIIGADRGFGNERFISYLEDSGFEYMVRLQPNMAVKVADNSGIMSDVIVDEGVYSCDFEKWKKLAIL